MRRRTFLARSAALPGAVLAAGAAWPLPPAPGSTPSVDRAPRRRARDDRFEEVAALLERRMQEEGVPGAALGVVKDGETLLRGFGVTSVDDPRPVTPHTVFELASLSKTVTATAMMRLVRAGTVALDAPVPRYLPGFRLREEGAADQVTVEHLLTHSPGWEGQLGTDDLGEETLERFADSMADLPLLAPPGTVWGYNNAGFALAGRLIEVVHGRDIHRSLRELVFDPLDLERASTRAVDVMTWPLALGHRGAPGEVSVIRPFSMGSSPTAGGVCMPVSELIRFAAFHLGEPVVGDMLDGDTLADMRRARLPKAPTDDAMGLGWHLRPLEGVMTAAHGGTAGAGHRLLLELVPERNLAFAILTNHTDGWRVVQDVERALLGVYEELALAPNQAICHRGIDEDMRAHTTALAEQPDPAPYLGTYDRTPGPSYEARVDDGRLVLGRPGRGGGAQLVFFGPDVAYAEGSGTPYEFVRDGSGRLGWVRVNGRIARKQDG